MRSVQKKPKDDIMDPEVNMNQFGYCCINLHLQKTEKVTTCGILINPKLI